MISGWEMGYLVGVLDMTVESRAMTIDRLYRAFDCFWRL